MLNTVVRSNFLGEFDDIFSALARATDQRRVNTGESVPQANISKDDKSYLIAIAAPGLSRGDFNIQVSDNILTVSANNDIKNNENSIRHEYSYHKFSRAWSLPEDVDVENITAEYRSGVLDLNIPVNKVIINKTKRIEVN